MVLGWDIETTGFNATKELVTVAACYSPDKQTVYQFAELGASGNVVKIHDFNQKRHDFLKELDDAPILAAFNGISFDIPFITTALDIAPDRVMKWVLKSIDIFESCKRACTGRTFGLNLLLGLNGFSVKTGSGAEAVVQAKAGEWEKLAKYCAEDARLTYEISILPRIAIPEGFQWRKKHCQRDHDPANMLFMTVGLDHQINFEVGALDTGTPETQVEAMQM
jgi:DNA polymerase III epsilon subunit-like protein